ncbi:MAG: hypothetical protein VKJ64_19390 [Leptolyngbyaceae bacterium]|nr:hypothetical protein [Leptolyngbyaceae bacterium]
MSPPIVSTILSHNNLQWPLLQAALDQWLQPKDISGKSNREE